MGSWHVISIAACCHSVKLCALAARAFRSSTKWCCDQDVKVVPQKKRAIDGVVRCKKEGMLLQPLGWRCVECAIHHERDVCEE